MFLFLDTETTGVTPRDRIVSICWSVYDADAGELGTEHHVIYPDGFTIPPEAARIHGITTRVAREKGIPIQRALRLLREQIDQHKPSLYVGHNVAFDRPIVINEYARLSEQENLSSMRTYCTMKSTTHVCCIPNASRGGYKWPKLAELHRHLFGRVHGQAHDAEGDVRACARCFFELQARGLVR
jgi:DNA polymerase III epsilon subunit-like protein